jgi:hypothetical protein
MFSRFFSHVEVSVCLRILGSHKLKLILGRQVELRTKLFRSHCFVDQLNDRSKADRHRRRFLIALDCVRAHAHAHAHVNF